MIDVELGTRKVVVLGHDPGRVDATALIAEAADRALPLLVLTLGYPVSTDQGRLVAAMIDQAFVRGVSFEALLVTDRSDLAANLRPDDEFTVMARGREGRRIDAVLEARSTGSRRSR